MVTVTPPTPPRPADDAHNGGVDLWRRWRRQHDGQQPARRPAALISARSTSDPGRTGQHLIHGQCTGTPSLLAMAKTSRDLPAPRCRSASLADNNAAHPEVVSDASGRAARPTAASGARSCRISSPASPACASPRHRRGHEEHRRRAVLASPDPHPSSNRSVTKSRRYSALFCDYKASTGFEDLSTPSTVARSTPGLRTSRLSRRLNSSSRPRLAAALASCGEEAVHLEDDPQLVDEIALPPIRAAEVALPAESRELHLLASFSSAARGPRRRPRTRRRVDRILRIVVSRTVPSAIARSVRAGR